MRLFVATSLVVASLAAAHVLGAGEPAGRLVLVGGGATTPEIAARVLETAGGPERRMLILPQVSEDPGEAGRESAEFWRAQGAKEVSCLDVSNPKKAVAAVEAADLIWIPGGDQSRLMKALDGTGVIEAIRKRHAAGAAVGGTSAGAALMSLVMITGDPPDREGPDSATPTAGGLGLWPDAIVDQHFLTRGRFGRLLRAVLDHPTLLGIGIDEATGIVVTAGAFEVFGAGSVTVLDARKATLSRSKEGAPAVTGLLTHLLRAGERFDPERGVLPR